MFREALKVSRESFGDRHPDTLASINNLGSLLETKGDLAAAEPLYREALEGLRETLGDRHPDTLASIHEIGLLLQAKGDLAAAEPLLREALEAQRETLGDRHPDTLISVNTLGSLLQAKGDLAAAESLLREALEVKRETLGNRHPSTLTSINNLGILLHAKGDLAAAELLCREALEARRETLGNRHPETLGSINSLGHLLQAKGDFAAAEPFVREAMEGRRESLERTMSVCWCRAFPRIPSAQAHRHQYLARCARCQRSRANPNDARVASASAGLSASTRLGAAGVWPSQSLVEAVEVRVAAEAGEAAELSRRPPPRRAPPRLGRQLGAAHSRHQFEAANSQALYPAGSSAEQARGTRRRWLSVKAVREAKAALYPAGSSAEEWRLGSIKALHEAAAAHEAEMAEQLADHWAEQAGFRVLSI